jgi:hypothetical protein
MRHRVSWPIEFLVASRAKRLGTNGPRGPTCPNPKAAKYRRTPKRFARKQNPAPGSTTLLAASRIFVTFPFMKSLFLRALLILGAAILLGACATSDPMPPDTALKTGGPVPGEKSADDVGTDQAGPGTAAAGVRW